MEMNFRIPELTLFTKSGLSLLSANQGKGNLVVC